MAINVNGKSIVTGSDLYNSSPAFTSNWVSAAQNLLDKFNTLSEAKIPNYVNNIAIGSGIPYTAAPFTKPKIEKITTLLNTNIGDVDINQANVDNIAIPTLSAIKPQINIPAPPSVALPDAPTSKPPFVAPTLPDAPLLTLPELPTLTAINIPASPVADIPAFDYCAPKYNIDPPTNMFTWSEEEYFSPKFDAFREKVFDELTYGGYGIETNDEIGIWDRAREREDIATQQAEDTIRREFSSRGFKTPPGVMFESMEKLRAQSVMNQASLSREVALKRNDLYVQNRQFVYQQMQQCEQHLINVHMAYMERQLNVSKAIAENALGYWQAQIQAYNTQLDAYKTYASVFESKVRAAVSAMEAYRLQLEAEKAKGDIDRLKIESYRAQVDSIKSAVDIYRARMDGAKIHTEIENLKLQAFKTEVDAYSATVGAQQARFGMYEAQVRGEVTKLQGYEAEVKAYVAQVDATRSQADIESAKIKANIDVARIKQDQVRLKLEKAKAEIELAMGKARMGLEEYQTDANVHRINSEVLAEAQKINIASSELQLKWEDTYKTHWENEVRNVIERFNVEKGLQLKAAEAGFTFYSKGIQSAMQAASSIIVQQVS